MPLRFFVEGEIMDDRDRYARFATHLNNKKAGPLGCPICNATESFEAKGALSGPSPDPLAPTDLDVPVDVPTPTNPRFNYASCTDCGYSIFFDTEASDLLE
jgi:predicted nucleic-acid-binding Zn-ribbon protein